MPIVENVKHVFEPNPLACGQAVLSMLSGDSVENVMKVVKTDRETTLKDMFSALDFYGIKYSQERKAVREKQDLPSVCIVLLTAVIILKSIKAIRCRKIFCTLFFIKMITFFKFWQN